MPPLYPGRRYARAKAPLQIVRGYRPTEPGHLSVTASPKDSEDIKQGMAITLDSDGKWIKATGLAVSDVSVSVYVARQDQDDPAVQASGKLTGLDCSGEFEFLTGYFVSGTNYMRDSELTIQAGTGCFKLATTTGDKVVGKVSATGSAADRTVPYVGLTPPTATIAGAARLQFKTVPAYKKYA